MPLYQYACERHGAFEQHHSMSVAGNPQKCPTCGYFAPRSYQPCAIVSDTALFDSSRLDSLPGGKDNTLIGQHYRKLASAAGVVTRGKQYIGGLARFPGDPRAWVDSRGDAARVARASNMQIADTDGKVLVKNEPEPPQQKGISETLVKRYVDRAREIDPSVSVERATEDCVNRHAPRDGKRIIKPRRKIPKVKMPKV